jgi:hypothetical protein
MVRDLRRPPSQRSSRREMLPHAFCAACRDHSIATSPVSARRRVYRAPARGERRLVGASGGEWRGAPLVAGDGAPVTRCPLLALFVPLAGRGRVPRRSCTPLIITGRSTPSVPRIACGRVWSRCGCERRSFLPTPSRPPPRRRTLSAAFGASSASRHSPAPCAPSVGKEAAIVVQRRLRMPSCAAACGSFECGLSALPPPRARRTDSPAPASDLIRHMLLNTSHLYHLRLVSDEWRK